MAAGGTRSKPAGWLGFGYLAFGSADQISRGTDAFLEGLRSLGYIDGKNSRSNFVSPMATTNYCQLLRPGWLI
jgi:hypothetical protein